VRAIAGTPIHDHGSATEEPRAQPADVTASYHRLPDLAMAGSFALPTAAYSLAEASAARQAQASSPGQKIVVLP